MYINYFLFELGIIPAIQIGSEIVPNRIFRSMSSFVHFLYFVEFGFDPIMNIIEFHPSFQRVKCMSQLFLYCLVMASSCTVSSLIS